MSIQGWANSVVTRLVVCFCAGGVLLSIGLGMLEYQRATQRVEAATAQHMLITTRNLQDVLRSLMHSGQDEAVRSALTVFSQDPRIIGVRIDSPGVKGIAAGQWDAHPGKLVMWRLNDPAGQSHGKLSLNYPTMMISNFATDDRMHTLQMLIDGPFIKQRTRGQIIRQFSGMWVVLGLLTLIGLLMLRRWLILPLSQLLSLTRHNARAEQFAEASEQMSGEFSDLARSIARMLGQLDDTTHQLELREQAFEHLYQFAPAAMISVGPNGRIVEANRRAAELLSFTDEKSLIGAEILQFILAEDRGLFRQCIDRVELNRLHRSELRLSVNQQVRDLMIEFAAVHDQAHRLTHVRLSLMDVTETRRLSRHVNEQRQLMDRVIAHLSDAILLVGADGRIITGNDRLSQLLHLNLDDMVGQPYDVDAFWSRLEMLDHGAFVQRMRYAIKHLDRPVQEQFETSDGAFLFQVIPVFDETHQRVAQLWVMQEVSAHLRARRLLEQQARQLRALRQVGYNLQHIEDLDDLLVRAVGELSRLFDVEAVGLALRGGEHGRRCRQLFSLRGQSTALTTGRAIHETVAEQLLPRVLPNRATSFWADLSQHGKWTQALTAAGFETLAATSLFNRHQTQGVFWIARRGGRPIERHHLFMVEALTPLLSACVENAEIRQKLGDWKLTDPVTALPRRRLARRMIARRVVQTGMPWSLTLIELDDYAGLCERAGQRVARQVARGTANLLREQCRACDDIVQYRRDQFLVISDDQDRHAASRYAERLGHAIGGIEYIDAAGQSHLLKATWAVAGSPDDHEGEATTLKIVEQRLHAKRAADSKSAAGQR